MNRKIEAKFAILDDAVADWKRVVAESDTPSSADSKAAKDCVITCAEAVAKAIKYVK